MRRRPRCRLPLSLVLAFLCCARARAQGPRSPEEIARGLEELARRSEGALAMEEYGRTAGGRPLLSATLALPGEAPPARRPGILVAANLEGSLPATSELVLAVIESLLARRAEPDVRSALERGVISFVPCASPDAAARASTRPLHESRLNTRPDDQDRDGRIDEDGPEDLDGDGEILTIRVPDAEGPFVLDPKDERLMRPVEPSEERAARFRVLEEGIDHDGDGVSSEDGPGGVDVSRNFPHDFEEHGPGAGPYPASEPESRSLLEFVLARPSFEAAITYGAGDDLLVPPEPRDGPPEKRGEHRRQKQDVELHAKAAERYRELTGLKAEGRKRGPRARGSFPETLYFELGIASYAAAPFPAEDAKLDARTFMPWHAYRHPQLGQMEIGGFRPFARGNPPREEVARAAEGHARFLVEILSSLARVAIESIRVKDAGGGVFEVRARVSNAGRYPTALRQGVYTARRAPIQVDIRGGGVRVLEEPSRRSFDALEPGRTRDLRWLVLAAAGSRASIEVRQRSRVLAESAFDLAEGGSL